MSKLRKEDIDYVTSVFPEVEQIVDECLKKKVIEVWIRACRYGAWENIEDIPLFLPHEKIPKSVGVEHVRGVTRCAIEMAKVYKEIHKADINMDFIVAGGLLHDIGKALEFAPAGKTPKTGEIVRHTFSGVYLAMEVGLPLEVVHIIATHAMEGQYVKRSLEAMIIFYADFLSADILLRKYVGRTIRPSIFLPA